jgi:acyl-coenzyme A thioesterase PaaI-like protein
MDLTELARRLLEPIPANRSVGIRVLRAKDGRAEVTVDSPPHMANVIGSLHSSGLIALLDAAGLAAFIAAARSEHEFADVVPLGAAAQLRFRAPARGHLIARCHLDEQALTQARALFAGDTGKIGITTTAHVFDATGTEVCVGSFDWRVRRDHGAA